MSDSICFERGGSVLTARTVLLFTDRIRRDGLLWITPARIERATLVHELGHALGLVSNPRHTQGNHPAHCTRPRCVMNQPGFGSRIHNALAAFFAAHIPHEYGDLCRADIETAKRMWAALAANHPGFAEQLRQARARREITTAEIWRAARQPL